MPCIEWDDSYLLGIQQIDHQHHHLFNSICALYNALVQKKDINFVISVLDELAAYTMNHFDTEEAHFDDTGYEKADEHKLQHESFCRRVNDLRENLKKGKQATFTGEVVLLSAWLPDHIKKHDAAYVECFNEHGIY